MIKMEYKTPKMDTSIAAGFTPREAYIGPKDMTSKIYGSSTSDIIASDVSSGSSNGYKSGPGNMMMNNQSDINIREKINPNRDRIVEAVLFEMYGRFDHWKRLEIEPSHLKSDSDNNLKENKKDNYSYQSQYQKYDKKDSIAKEKDAREKGIEPEYKAGQRNERISRLYGIEAATGISQREYDPLRDREDSPIQGRTHDTKIRTLETLLYSSIANNHAYHSLTQPANAQNYIAANGNYTITLSEGYIKELDLRYVNMSVKNNEEEQNYQLLIRYQKGKDRKVGQDKKTAEEIAALVKRLNQKERIDEDAVMETLTATLKRKKLTLELTEEEIGLIRKTRESKGKDAIRSVWLVDKKKSRFRELNIKREEASISSGKYYQKPTINFSYPAKDAYAANFERKRNDFTNLVPPKNIHKFPPSIMGGVLGFTYLGDSFVGIRDDLNEHEAHEVEIHEAIHTPDEYETRVITKWMLDDNTHYH